MNTNYKKLSFSLFMKGKNNMLKKAIQIVLIGFLLTSCAAFPEISASSSDSENQMINVTELQDLIETEDFTFVNVHIPLEGNIPGTDVQIPFDEIEDFQELLPEDKDERIVLYCRSGSMSNTASQTLVGLGYTNVLDLEGGYNAWVAAGLPFEE